MKEETVKASAQSRLTTWLIPAAVVLLAAVLVALAPEERTLGRGIKIVYVHVSLIWTGMVSLILSGVVGLAVAVTNRPRLEAWNRTVSWVGLAMFSVGLILSGPAARMNWGGVFWQEPRTLAALEVLAVGLIIQVLVSWPLPLRLKGILHLGLVLFMVWSVQTTPLVLHPRDPARASSSLAIRATFFGLFGLVSLLAAWIVVRLGPRAEPAV